MKRDTKGNDEREREEEEKPRVAQRVPDVDVAIAVEVEKKDVKDVVIYFKALIIILSVGNGMHRMFFFFE